MPTHEGRGVKLLRWTTLVASCYLIYLWVEVMRWDLQRSHLGFHLLTLILFVALSWKAWSGARWAGLLATCLPLVLLVPLDATSGLAMALGSLYAPSRIYLYALSLLVAALTWTLLVLALHRQTLRSIRSQAHGPAPL